MRIQLLTFAGCPSAPGARAALRAALATLHLPPDFDDLDVNDAATPEPLKQWGSPTILIDGRDLVGAAPTGPSCRLYEGALPGQPGVPPAAVIERALREAMSAG